VNWWYAPLVMLAFLLGAAFVIGFLLGKGG
jgi:hypothetical protein